MQKTFLMWGIVCGRLAAKAFCKRPRPAEGEKKLMPSFLPTIPPAHFIRHLPLHKGGFRRQATTNPAPKFFYYFFHRKAVPPLFAGNAKREKAPPA